MTPNVEKGALSVAFVRLSANISRSQRPSVHKFGMKVPTLDGTHTPVSTSNDQKSGLQIGRPYRANPADGHTACLQTVFSYHTQFCTLISLRYTRS